MKKKTKKFAKKPKKSDKNLRNNKENCKIPVLTFSDVLDFVFKIRKGKENWGVLGIKKGKLYYRHNDDFEAGVFDILVFDPEYVKFTRGFWSEDKNHIVKRLEAYYGTETE